MWITIILTLNHIWHSKMPVFRGLDSCRIVIWAPPINWSQIEFVSTSDLYRTGIKACLQVYSNELFWRSFTQTTKVHLLLLRTSWLLILVYLQASWVAEPNILALQKGELPSMHRKLAMQILLSAVYIFSDIGPMLIQFVGVDQNDRAWMQRCIRRNVGITKASRCH